MSSKSNIRDPPNMFEPYHEWKNEVYIWSDFVDDKIELKKQGMALFLSLQGDARKAASKVPLAQMKTETGLQKVLDELDKFFLKDKDRSAFLAYDKFNAFRRPEGMSVKDFLVKFELLKNTCESHDVVIPDKIAAHQLLQSVNIATQKRDIIVSTLSSFSLENMRNQILRVFCEEDTPSIDSEMRHLNIKSEPFDDDSKLTLMGSSRYSYNRSSKGRRANRGNGKGQGRSPFNPQSQSVLRRNPPDEYGNTTTCDFCHSVYHYVPQCPDKDRPRSFDRNQKEHHL